MKHLNKYMQVGTWLEKTPPIKGLWEEEERKKERQNASKINKRKKIKENSKKVKSEVLIFRFFSACRSPPAEADVEEDSAQKKWDRLHSRLLALEESRLIPPSEVRPSSWELKYLIITFQIQKKKEKRNRCSCHAWLSPSLSRRHFVVSLVLWELLQGLIRVVCVSKFSSDVFSSLSLSSSL